MYYKTKYGPDIFSNVRKYAYVYFPRKCYYPVWPLIPYHTMRGLKPQLEYTRKWFANVNKAKNLIAHYVTISISSHEKNHILSKCVNYKELKALRLHFKVMFCFLCFSSCYVCNLFIRMNINTWWQTTSGAGIFETWYSNLFAKAVHGKRIFIHRRMFWDGCRSHMLLDEKVVWLVQCTQAKLNVQIWKYAAFRG